MVRFNDVLPTLPDTQHIKALELTDAAGTIISILNQPGSSGSIAVYHAITKDSGTLTQAAALRGLELYAEHTDDARKHPGKHPNIDRLFAIAESKQTYQVKVIPQ